MKVFVTRQYLWDFPSLYLTKKKTQKLSFHGNRYTESLTLKTLDHLRYSPYSSIQKNCSLTPSLWPTREWHRNSDTAWRHRTWHWRPLARRCTPATWHWHQRGAWPSATDSWNSACRARVAYADALFRAEWQYGYSGTETGVDSSAVWLA